MPFNYAKLKGRIIEMTGSQSNFAKKIGLSERALSLKMNNKTRWKQDEIIEAVKILEIPDNEIPEYFFKVEVQNI